MNPLIKFLASGVGRVVRIVAGVALIAWGLLGLSGAAAIVVIVIGLVPLLAGLFDVCVFAPLFKNPFRGAQIREG
jgi:Inner membrane protein YgaP-like, transmembrane domain